MSKKKKLHHFRKKIILFCVVCFLAGAILMSFYLHGQKKSDKVVSPSTLLSELREELYLKTSDIESGQAIWVDTDGNMSILKGEDFVGLNQISEGENTPLSEISKSFFESQGFEVSPKNTFSTLNTDNVYKVESLGFTKDNAKCLVTIFIQSEPSGYYFCGVEDVYKNNLQKEFMPVVYGLDQKYPLTQNEKAVLDIKKINNSFAYGTNNRYLNGVYEPSGTTFVAAKVNGVWKLVFDGQDYPMCAQVDEYNVPQEFYKNCFLPDFTLRYSLP